jgi:hypothetical protein
MQGHFDWNEHRGGGATHGLAGIWIDWMSSGGKGESERPFWLTEPTRLREMEPETDMMR